MTPNLLVLAPDGKWTTTAETPSDQGDGTTWDDACWYVFTAPDAELHPQLAALLHQHGVERPDVDIVYGDEVVASAPGRPLQLLCKPAFDETQLISQDYIGLPVAFRGSAMRVLGGPDASAVSAQVYDMLLRAVTAGLEIGRITQVLAVNHTEARATTADRLTVLKQAWTQSRPDCQVVPGLVASSIELRRNFDDPPPVTVLIVPGLDRVPVGPALLDSLARTDWPMSRLHILLEEGMAAKAGPSWPFTLRQVTVAPSLGQTATANRLWQASETEHLVLLDEGLLAHGPGWLRGLMTFAVDESIGGVGARLLHPDGTTRHVGMPWGLPGPATFTDRNWGMIQREWSMVSGGAFATRRSLLEYVNGLDARFGFSCSQADLCLRLRLLGFRIVYTPYAEFTQRDALDPASLEADETALFLEKWQTFMADDPAYHPRMTRSGPIVTAGSTEDDWWRQRPNSRPNKPLGAGGGTGADGTAGGGAGGVQSA